MVDDKLLQCMEVAIAVSEEASGSPAKPVSALDEDETLADAHCLLGTMASAPADIAIAHGMGGHSYLLLTWLN